MPRHLAGDKGSHGHLPRPVVGNAEGRFRGLVWREVWYDGHTMSPYRKVTYSLPAEVVDAVADVVSSGDAASKSAVVAEALAAYLARREQDRRERTWSEAAADPDFIRRNQEVLRDFEAADAEAWAALPSWDQE